MIGLYADRRPTPLARRFARARFTSACASRASKVFKRSEDTDITTGATVGPVPDSGQWFELLLQSKDNTAS